MWTRSAPDPRDPASDQAPAYAGLLAAGGLSGRAARAAVALAPCRVCPRACGVDRLAGEVGRCRIGRHAHVASAFPHHGEETCLSGWRGSGTVFFAGCNLRCVFCQNADISQVATGEPCTAQQLAELMLGLQAFGCHNVNLVTPEHVVPQVLEAIDVAARRGLELPIVWNTSAYDSVEMLRLLEGVVDVYMPDFKVWEDGTAERYVHARDYPERAREALVEMHRQVGVLVTDAHGLARRGVLVRHLVLPGLAHETAAILAWLAEALSPDTYVNVMAQYRPQHRVGREGPDGRTLYPELDRRPFASELRAAYAAGRRAGLHRFDGLG